MIDFVHPATTHDEAIVTLHSLLDRDVYRGGAIVVGPVRRGRGRRVRVERRVVPVSADPERRLAVLERELWRIAVENLDYSEQHAWAALAGARVDRQQLAPGEGDAPARPGARSCGAGSCSPACSATATTSSGSRRWPRSRPCATPSRSTTRSRSSAPGRATSAAPAPRCCSRRSPSAGSAAATRRRPGSGGSPSTTRELHEEYAVQRWPETKRLLGLFVNSSGRAHGRNARRIVHAARQQDRRLAVALLAAAVAHTPEAEEVLRGARMRMARKPSAVARELLRNFPKGGRRRRRRSKRGGEEQGGERPNRERLDPENGDSDDTAAEAAEAEEPTPSD